MVVSNIFDFHPNLGKIPILTNIFQMGWFNHQLVTVKQCRAPKYTGPEILQKGELCGGVYLRSAQNAQIFSILRVFQLQRRYGIFTLPKTNIFVLKSPFPLGSLEIPNLEKYHF